MKKVLKNQKGFTLIEVMIAAAISIIVGLGVLKINENSQKGLSSVKDSTELQSVQRWITTHLSNPDKCLVSTPVTSGHNWETGGTPGTADPGGTNPPDHTGAPATLDYVDFTGNGTTLSIAISATPTVTKDFTVNTAVETPAPWTNNWKFTGYRFYQVANKSELPGTQGNGTCYLKMNFSKIREDKTIGGKDRTLWFTLSCNVAADSTLVSCYSAEAGDDQSIWVDNNDAVGFTAGEHAITQRSKFVLGGDTRGTQTPVASMDILPGPDGAPRIGGGTGLPVWVGTGTNAIGAPVNGVLGAAIRVPRNSAIIFGDDADNVGIYNSLAETDSLTITGTTTIGDDFTPTAVSSFKNELSVESNLTVHASITTDTNAVPLIFIEADRGAVAGKFWRQVLDGVFYDSMLILLVMVFLRLILPH